MTCTLVSGVHHSGSTFVFLTMRSPRCVGHPPVTLQSHRGFTDCPLRRAARPVTGWGSNCQFVRLVSLHLLRPTRPLAATSLQSPKTKGKCQLTLNPSSVLWQALSRRTCPLVVSSPMNLWALPVTSLNFLMGCWIVKPFDRSYRCFPPLSNCPLTLFRVLCPMKMSI